MKHNIFYYLFVAAFLMSYSASAQNLDPTVEVSRDYEGKLLVVHKPILDMAVPAQRRQPQSETGTASSIPGS